MTTRKNFIIGAAVLTAIALSGCSPTADNASSNGSSNGSVSLEDAVKAETLPAFSLKEKAELPAGWEAETEEGSNNVVFTKSGCAVSASPYIAGDANYGSGDKYATNTLLGMEIELAPGSEPVREEASIPSNIGALEVILAHWKTDGTVPMSDEVIAPQQVAKAVRVIDSPINVKEEDFEVTGAPVLEVIMNCDEGSDAEANIKEFKSILESLKIDGLERK